jgi:hypothetical protein
VVFDGQVAGKITTESIKQRVGAHLGSDTESLAVEEHR